MKNEAPSLNHNTALAETFNKCVTVAEDGTVTFTHQKKRYHLQSDAFKPGMTYLVTSAYEVMRGGVRVGDASDV